METTGFWAYGWAVLRRIGSDIKKHVAATVLVLVGGGTVALLQERFKIITPDQTWTRTIINVIPSAIYLTVAAMVFIVRAPWKLYVEQQEQSSAAIQQLSKQHDDAIVLLAATQAKIGRPYVTLRFEGFDIRDVADASRTGSRHIDIDAATELVAVCEGRNALDFMIELIPLGKAEQIVRPDTDGGGQIRIAEFYLQSSYPIEINVGEAPKRVPYKVLYGEEKAISYNFAGGLKLLFGLMLRLLPESETINILFRFRYYDSDGGTLYRTEQMLCYVPGIKKDTPVMMAPRQFEPMPAIRMISE